ncbi:hypothetical protein [Sphingomonas sp. Leaf20]|jgi:hypothetical protein|uniref:hypothetical protein n=1 Tax=Sphingomonas sp. Leaf20 TaxID=1735685 RepID=UPI0006F963F5|nr:hypothetical protein [Sphingomonas sp. Leaf20]KQM73493.1 hypothetical protein ASE72_02350 [Sphingomonas sp. Leaf20]
MTAAYRLKGVGWFGGCVAVVLGFYLVSLQVAAERKKLEAVNGQIRFAERDIRALETEFDTRANLVQLERWNGDTLALSAPTAGQFVASESALAALDVNQIGNRGTIQTAQLLVPSMPVIAPVAAPAAVPAAVTNVGVQTAAVAAALKPVVIRASVQMPKSAEAAIVRAASTERLAAVAKVRPQAVAMLDRKLLSDTTLGSILNGARAEAGRLR